MLKRIKDSITESGGMTAEVKAHVRELRGEVLGMGRDIARRLAQAESAGQTSKGDVGGPTREEIAHIVQEGLIELKEQMESLMREKRRQSSSSMTSRNSVDGQEGLCSGEKRPDGVPPTTAGGTTTTWIRDGARRHTRGGP